MSAVGRAAGTPLEWAVRGLVALGLGVDAWVHLTHAGAMQLAAPGGVGGGALFRVQGAVAALTAVVVLLTGSRAAYAVAALVALSALGPALLYTYVEVPALGPVPSMYDPTWSSAKVASVVAEAAVVALALVGWRLTGRTGDAGTTKPPAVEARGRG